MFPSEDESGEENAWDFFKKTEQKWIRKTMSYFQLEELCNGENIQFKNFKMSRIATNNKQGQLYFSQETTLKLIKFLIGQGMNC